jgi:hypothetical protein
MRIPTPKLTHDYEKPFVYNKTMCKSCAYHTPMTQDEIEMERDMRMLRPEKHHACHERPNSWCKGSENAQKLFENVNN